MRLGADSSACRRACVGLVAAGLASALAAQPVPLLTPVDHPATDGMPGAPWTIEKLPQQSFGVTRFRIAQIEGSDVMRIDADGSYGNLVHRLDLPAPGGLVLRWRWRVDVFNAGADLRQKQSDDTSAKVCVLFDLPLDRVPFIERQVMRIARSRSGRNLPAASICYVWDNKLPAGTRIDNAYSRRVRYLVLRSGFPGQWMVERRDVAADFQSLFGDESAGAVPPVQAVAIGADADNTGGKSLAFIADLRLDR